MDRAKCICVICPDGIYFLRQHYGFYAEPFDKGASLHPKNDKLSEIEREKEENKNNIAELMA